MNGSKAGGEVSQAPSFVLRGAAVLLPENKNTEENKEKQRTVKSCPDKGGRLQLQVRGRAKRETLIVQIV